MAQKSSTNDDRVYAVIDERTLAEVDRIAAKYGATREEILAELIRTDPEERPDGVTLH